MNNISLKTSMIILLNWIVIVLNWIKESKGIGFNSINRFQRLKDALKSGDNDSEAGTEAYLVKRI